MRLDCIIQQTGEVCSHLENWYPRVVGSRPFFYWIIDDNDLKTMFGADSFTMVDTPNDLGDNCHSEISGLDDRQREMFVKARCKDPDLYVCNVDGSCKHIATPEDFARLGTILGYEAIPPNGPTE